MAKSNTWIYIILAIVAVFLLMGGDIGGLFGDEAEPTEKTTLPSSKQIEWTLKFQDDLATSTTNVNATWYAFGSDGTYKDSGEAGTDGSDTFTGNVETSYTLYAYNPMGESTGYLAKKVTLPASTDASDTKVIKLIKRSGIDNKNFVDPVDLDANISGVKGSTEEIRFQYQANVSNAGYRNPTIVLESNGTSVIDDIVYTSEAGASESSTYKSVTCPDRLSPSVAAHKLRCFQRQEPIYTSDGLIQVDFQVQFSDTTTAGNQDWIEGWVIDEAMWLTPGYETVDDVNFGFEDRDDSDVGAADSTKDKIYFSD